LIVRTPEYKLRQTQRQLERRRQNPEKYREMGRKSEHRRRLKRYGATEDWYATQLLIQNNNCEICELKLVPGRQTHIDHNHLTGNVRGLLCNHCNYLIGNAKEDINILYKAISYLERYNTCATS
jgi:Recombination endonuclease VII